MQRPSFAVGLLVASSTKQGFVVGPSHGVSEREVQPPPSPLPRLPPPLRSARFAALENHDASVQAYATVAALVFMLMTLQLLNALHFQPKLNLITRTVGAAAADLGELFDDNAVARWLVAV